MKFPCIVVDPPWQMKKAGRYRGGGRNERPRTLPYKTMSLKELAELPIAMLGEENCHIWLWVTDEMLIKGGALLEEWGFEYHAPIVWAKTSGYGNYFLHWTEFLLFGYRGKFEFKKARYIPNYYEIDELPEEMEPVDYRYRWPRVKTGQHSKKPQGAFDLIESVSDGPYLEIFARPALSLFPQREGWVHIGDEFDGQPITTSITALIRDRWPIAA